MLGLKKKGGKINLKNLYIENTVCRDEIANLIKNILLIT